MLLKGLNLGPHKYEFSSLAVSLALEGKASHRELTSRLLSDLSGKLLSQSDMARAFDKMLKELPDLILDTPEAPQVGRDAEGGKWPSEPQSSGCAFFVVVCITGERNL